LWVALHGFTLTGAQFSGLTAAAPCRILAPDLPGHGRTDVAPVTLDATLDALGEWIESLGGPVPVLGYSQGGRIALVLALARPELVDRLMLVSASPGIANPDERAKRTAADADLAESIRSEGLPAFLDRWLAGPLGGPAIADTRARTADRRLREENTADGLAAALTGLGQGSQPWVGDRLAELPMKLLSVAGELDARYVRIATEMADAAPRGRLAVVPGAGHNVVRDAPAALAGLIGAFG